MMLISHRGNIDGKNPERENTPDYIDEAIALGYYVEVDVWGLGHTLWLGHDAPKELVGYDFFQEREGKLFCHCKNVVAMKLLHVYLEWPTYFFHHTDDYTITNNGFVWCFPGKMPPHKDSVVVLPEIWMNLAGAPEYCRLHDVAGVCSDYISSFNKA